MASEASGAPTVSRRHQAGAPSARGLLLTVLGEFVLPGDGTAWTSAVLAAFARLGIAEKATRQALMRASNAGWLESQKDGRRARWVLTPAARKLLTDGAQRIYSFGQQRTWDQQWVVVSARIPDTDRRARHVIRTRLSWAGFGALASGLWISPHPERAAEAERVLRDAGAGGDAHVFVARRTGLGDTRAMVATAWDLPEVEAEYEMFLASFGGPPPADVLVRQIELVHAWRRFPSIDPALPGELLPARWNGARAARLFTERHDQWLEDARREWKRLNEVLYGVVAGSGREMLQIVSGYRLRCSKSGGPAYEVKDARDDEHGHRGTSRIGGGDVSRGVQNLPRVVPALAPGHRWPGRHAGHGRRRAGRPGRGV